MFNLAQLNPETANFYLTVNTADKIQFAIGQVTRQITGTIQPGSAIGAKAILDESFSGQSRLVQITPGQTGTTNMETFSEVAFSFRITPTVLFWAVLFAALLGLIGGALPAWRAARLAPTVALRRA